jgi:hypothetical protein
VPACSTHAGPQSLQGSGAAAGHAPVINPAWPCHCLGASP